MQIHFKNIFLVQKCISDFFKMEFKKDKIKGGFQHRLNELHLYCFLRKLGIPHTIAKAVARVISPKKVLYGNNNQEQNSSWVRSK